MGTVRIITDSGSDLPQRLADELGIVVVPLTVRFGETNYVDRKDLSTTEFWRKCKETPKLPETAAPAPGLFSTEYQKAKDDGCEGAIVVTLSEELSATIQSARMAAEQIDFPVTMVDSRSATTVETAIAVAAARASNENKTFDEVVKIAESVRDRSFMFAAIDTLENLRKGGRIGGAAALIGGMLSVKPLIQTRNGKVDQAGKVRTRAKAIAALVDRVKEAGPLEALYVMHAEAGDVDDLTSRLDQYFPAKDIVVCDVGAVIGTHVGPNCMGVSGVTKAD